MDRFTFYRGAYRHKRLPVIERGTRTVPEAKGEKINSPSPQKNPPWVLIEHKTGAGRTIYLNLSPLEYWDSEKRFGDAGNEWRAIVENMLAKSRA